MINFFILIIYCYIIFPYELNAKGAALKNGHYFLYETANLSSTYAAQELESLLKEPELEKIFRLTKINLATNTEAAEKFSTTSLPAIILIKNNKEIGRNNGYYPLDELRTKIKTILATNKG